MYGFLSVFIIFYFAYQFIISSLFYLKINIKSFHFGNNGENTIEVGKMLQSLFYFCKQRTLSNLVTFKLIIFFSYGF